MKLAELALSENILKEIWTYWPEVKNIYDFDPIPNFKYVWVFSSYEDAQSAALTSAALQLRVNSSYEYMAAVKPKVGPWLMFQVGKIAKQKILQHPPLVAAFTQEGLKKHVEKLLGQPADEERILMNMIAPPELLQDTEEE